MGHLWDTQEPNSRVRSAPALSGITLLPGQSGLLNHLPLDSRLRLPSEAYFILIDSRPELSYSASRSVFGHGQLRERHAFNMNMKGSKIQSLIDTDGVTETGKPPSGLHFTLRLVLFHDSKYSQPCHMYLPISRR